jgi:transcriptional regulator with XRE-family HTH domain
MNVILEFPKKLSKLFFMPTIHFAKNLKFLRKKMAITQTELGLKLDRKHTSIGNWESGFNQPSMKDLVEISIIFGISIDDLLNNDLSNVHLNSGNDNPKNSKNVHPNVHQSVHLKPEKGQKTSQNDNQENVLNDRSVEYKNETRIIDTLSIAVKGLERANARLEQELADLEEENRRLKSEIPVIGKKLDSKKARAS